MFDARSSPPPSAGSVQNEVESRSTTVSDLPYTRSGIASGRRPLAVSLAPTSRLLVMNLPTFLFSQTLDLHPLLSPFGMMKNLEILATTPGQIPETISVIVDFLVTSNAQEAKETLQGQSYSDHQLNVEYLTLATLDSPTQAQGACMGNRTTKLNPCAPTFVFETAPWHCTLARSPLHNTPQNASLNLFPKSEYLPLQAPPYPIWGDFPPTAGFRQS